MSSTAGATPTNPPGHLRTRDGRKLINLTRGWPSPATLPAQQLRQAADRFLAADPAVVVPGLQYGPDAGHPPLRAALAAWLGRLYGAGAGGGPERICITGGASQSIACILQSFTDPAFTRAVWAVAPCYFLACPILADAGFAGRLRAVPEDEEGVDLDALETGLDAFETDPGEAKLDRPVFKVPGPLRKVYKHIIYAVPTCANPSGLTMSRRRREGLVRLARKYNALVICDDVYDFLQWPVDSASAGDPVPLSLPLLPRLSDIDGALGATRHDPAGKCFGHAVSNGSFSKIIAPGVRTGWVHGTADFALGLAQTGSTKSGGAPSQLTAAVVGEMLASGALDDHLARTARPALRARHAAALTAVRTHLAGLGVGVSAASEGRYGGYFLWLTLPAGSSGGRAQWDAAEVAARAQEEEDLIIAPGKLFEVLGDTESATFPRNIRLCYAWEAEEDIVEGIARLGRVMQSMLDEGEGARAGKPEDPTHGTKDEFEYA